MKRLFFFSTIFVIQSVYAQQKADTAFKPSGNLWGLSFGDYYYKAHSDALNRGTNQYSNIEKGRNAFQIRRIYLGYNYNINSKFSAELLLAAEDNVVNSAGISSGDLLTNGKLSFFIKLVNVRWKNIWEGTDLIVGEVSTPAYVLLAEPIWGYRSVERTLSDMRGVPSYDLGAALQGKFDPDKGNFGYDIMVSNGSGARPEGDRFKWFSGDMYAKFLDKKIVVQLYADYQRFNWTPSFHHSRQMLKGFVAYTTPLFTAGVESFVNNNKDDVIGIRSTSTDTISAHAIAVSVFARGVIIKEKLNYFIRMDHFNPDTDFDENLYTSYKGLNPYFEPNNKQNFFTAGLDFTPAKNVHFMPNVWYTAYKNQRSSVSGTTLHDYDLAFRISFYYVYGK